MEAGEMTMNDMTGVDIQTAMRGRLLVRI